MNKIIENKNDLVLSTVYKFKRFKMFIASLIVVVGFRIHYAYASSIQGSSLFKGTQKLLQDVSSALLIIAPIVAGVCGIYFGIRLAMADEQDKKTWANRLKVLGVGFILTITITALIGVIATYYK